MLPHASQQESAFFQEAWEEEGASENKRLGHGETEGRYLEETAMDAKATEYGGKRDYNYVFFLKGEIT